MAIAFRSSLTKTGNMPLEKLPAFVFHPTVVNWRR